MLKKETVKEKKEIIFLSKINVTCQKVEKN